MNPATDRLWERFRDAPGDTRAFEALEQHHYLAGDWTALAELYALRLSDPALAEQPREQAQLRLRQAQVQWERLADAEAALESLAAALRADSQLRPALALLREIEIHRQRWDVVLQIAEAECELPARPDERAALFCDVGAIWLDQLDEPQQALASFERALECRDDDRARAGLARTQERLERFDAAAEHWEELIARRRGTARAEAQVALARLADERLGQPDRARSLYRNALGCDPSNAEAIADVLRQAESRSQWTVVAELLERRFELQTADTDRAETAARLGTLLAGPLANPAAAERWLLEAAQRGARDPAVFERLADAERERGDDDALRTRLEQVLALRGDDAPVSLLLEAASLHSDCGDDERALALLQRAARAAPDDALALMALSDTLARLGRDDELVDLLEHRAAAAADPMALATTLTELGTLYEERQGDLEGARHAYERAVAALPSASDAADALERLYRKSEDWNALRDLLDVRGRSGDPDQRASCRARLGQLLLDRFAAPDAAVDAFESALQLDPRLASAHRGVQRIHHERGDVDALFAAYEREADRTTDPPRLGFLASEISQRYLSRDDPQAALPWLLRWADALPDDAAAQSACADGLERLGRYADLAVTLVTLDPLLPFERRGANRRRLGAAHAAAGDSDAAIAAYRLALEIDPEDREALEALSLHLAASERFAELADVRRQLADVLTGAERRRCLEELATLLADRLQDHAAAIEVLKRLVAEPDPPDECFATLERLLRDSGRHRDRAQLLADRAARCADRAERVALELERARVLDELAGDTDAALDARRAAWRRYPEDARTRDAYAESLRDAGRTRERLAFLAHRVATGATAAERDGSAIERAELLADEPGEATAALRELRRVAAHASDPAHRRRARELACVALADDDPRALRAVLESALADGGPRVALHRRIARLCGDRLDDADGAIEHLRAAAQIAPDRAESWRDLGDAGARWKRPALECSAIEAEIALGVDAARETVLRGRAFRILCEAAERDAAARHAERLLALDPGHAAAGDFLVEQSLRAGNCAEALRHLEARLVALDGAEPGDDGASADQRASLRIRIAALRADRMDDLDGAIAALEPGLAECGPLPALAEPLAELYTRAERGDDLVSLCREVAEHATPGADRAIWFVRLAEAARGAGRLREAADAYREAASLRPDDGSIRDALCDVYRELPDPDALARSLEIRLPQLAGAEEVAVRTELADLLARRQDRPEDAFAHLRRALQLAPAHAPALARAIALPRSAAPVEAVDPLIAAALAFPAPAESRAALWSQRAALLADADDGAERAVAALREALRLDPTRSEDRRWLRDLLIERGDWTGALAHLEQELAATPDRVEPLRQAADLAWNHLGPDAALPWLERLLALLPDDAETAARICDAHRRKNRPRALVRALEREAALVSDPHRLHRERAAILERDLGSPARAVGALEAALACAPGDAATQQDLDRLYRLLGRHRDRADLIERRIAAAPEAPVALRHEVAALYAGPLQSPERAVEHLLHALAAAPDERLTGELLRALGRALRAGGDPDGWARCAERELASLDPDDPALSDRRRDLLQELAACYERELDRPDDALRHLRALLALKWTESHGAGAENRSRIESALLRLLRRQHAWIELADRLEERVARRPDDVACWRELAQLREERLRLPARAAEAHHAVVRLCPGDREAIESLLRCAERTANWADVAATLEHALRHLDDLSNAERAAVLRRLGEVYWHGLGSTTKASQAFGRALEADPGDVDALRALQDLLVAMEDWQGALDLFESEIEMLGDADPRRRQQAGVRAGEIAKTRLGDAERALRNFERAEALGDLPAPARAAMAELYWDRNDFERFASSFADWCRDPSTSPSASDLLRLAESFERVGADRDAADWIERAVALDAGRADAWSTAARLRAACGDAIGAAEALERCAALAGDPEASRLLHRAAFLRWPTDAQAARSLLRAATDRDPANAAACAAFARCSAHCERFEDAVEFAERAFACCDATDEAEALDSRTRIDTALAGARAARHCGDTEAAARLYPRVLAEDPEHADAAWELAQALAALEDWAACGRAVETVLAARTEDAISAEALALLGTARSRTGDTDAARERLEAALERDPGCEAAHRELVRLYAEADQPDAGIPALERWAGVAAEPSARAMILLRAASWERDRRGASETAVRLLREAVTADADLAPAWAALATAHWERGEADAAYGAAREGLDAVCEPETRGTLALIRARAIERRGDRAEALAAFGEAAAGDPTNLEAALSHARLLRGAGEWQGAADALARFAADPANRTQPALADVLTQLARLRAGPLEDLEGAIDSYRSAVDADPERIEARAALAEFLSHRPDDRAEAWEHLRQVLSARPTHTPSLRVAVRLLRDAGDDDAAATGAAILAALGDAPPDSPVDSGPTFATAQRLDDPLAERIRQIARIAAEDLSTALETPALERAEASDDPAARFRDALMQAESQLTAPALIPLDEAALRETITLVAALALEPEQVHGDGQLVNALSGAIRRRTRKRLQRELRDVSRADIAAFDFGAWRRDVRALAAVNALASSGCELRTALAALIETDARHRVGDAPAPADWLALVEADPRARALVQRVVRDWLQSIRGNR